MDLSSLEMKIPPVAVMLLTALFMGGYSLLLSESSWDLTLRLFLGLSLAILGGGIAMLGVKKFQKYKTSVNPLAPNQTHTIVRDGIYAYTRNPMYVGFAVLLSALALLLGKLILLLWVVFFIIYITRFQIKPEEEFLSKKFGKQFEDYKKSVRRWL